jgi:arylsulfatase A-like enzyme
MMRAEGGEPMRVVVIAADGLRPDYLGGYGCEWVPTPTVDQWAAEGTVYDWHFADTPRPPDAAQLRDRLAGVPFAAVPFERAAEEPFALKPTRRAVRKAIEQFGDADPAVLWVEIGVLLPPWDLPDEVAADAFADADEDEDEDDELLPWTDELPSAVTDDRTLDRLQRTYAAAMTAFDAGLAKLWADLDKRGWGDQAAWVLTSFRGLPLGDRGVAGFADGPPHEELVHLPLVVRRPDGAGSGERVVALTQPADALDLIAGLVGRPAELAAREAIIVAGRGVRTADAYLIAGDPPRLFRKPDDRWEVNDVSQHHPEEVDALASRIGTG